MGTVWRENMLELPISKISEKIVYHTWNWDTFFSGVMSQWKQTMK